MSPILTEEELAKYKNQSADYEKKIAERDAAIERQQKENEAIENKKRTATTIAVILLILLLVVIALAYTSPSTLGISSEKATTETSQQEELVSLKSENENLKQEISILESQLEKKQSSVDFKEPETYFSVQVGAFERYEVPTLSKDFLVLRGDENYYLNSYSIGVFQTLEEAQKLRSALEKMGFDDVFTAKYKNAKRIDIIE
ncbi:MAG: hypothetical protein ACTHYV_02780 [Psychroflexus sp.]|uniref:hypothetical protein n=1 Tax=Psychroflexus sp. S27 TaxID=1982757 RepID=UPI000C2A7D4F|nr:hypothetical protein [Psychroflexus sp. S27]PJX20655.1 hypothetical protein CAP47_10420 [Psychroflexus sp. S27]